MKIAILGESEADELVVSRLVQLELGVPIQVVEKQLESRGWPAVRNVLPAVIRILHYRTDADGLVVIADSNHSLFHEEGMNLRYRELVQIIKRTLSSLTAIPSRPLLRVAVGVPCPAIEAWLVAHRQPNVNEAEWIRGLACGTDPYSKSSLKQKLYGIEKPSLTEEKKMMIEAITEVSFSRTDLEFKFPQGYGLLAKELRSWLRVSGDAAA